MKRCRRCGTTRPLVDGKRTCAPCDESERRDNRERNHMKRAWAHKNGINTPMIVVAAQRKVERQQRIQALNKWAKRHRRVPTVLETATIIGLARGKGTYLQALRREAFNLRPALTGRAAIPYPVPPDHPASAASQTIRE